MYLKNKKVLVVGLGLQGGGVSTVKWLVEQGAKVTVTDLKTKKQLIRSVRSLKGCPVVYRLGGHNLKILKGQELIVQNPAVPNDSKIIKAAVTQALPIENEASLFFKFCLAPIIAITGSKGKSTVTAWLGKIFSSYNKKTVVAGNIKDRLMLDELPHVKPNTPVILELSSWHLEGLSRWRLSPQVALITNILPDHLNRYRTIDDYVKAKTNIFKFQKKNDLVVLNYDNQVTQRLSRKISSRLFWYSTTHIVANGCYIKKGYVYYCYHGKSQKIYSVKSIKLLGQHNLSNALAVTTLAKVAGMPTKFIRQGIKEFKGLHSRLELVASKHGVKYYNDTTATIPLATLAALDSFKQKSITLIAGGADKKLDFCTLAKQIKKQVNKLILLPGTATDKLKRELSPKYQFYLVNSMRQAVKLAARVTPNGGVVIMSPAAASFGLFVNEWDRGEQFIKSVKLLN
ncbi:MAG: UDP-N-acetylmuramoyl-L-alanine--D-glutamate ligase [Patescibacteria group bacterium]